MAFVSQNKRQREQGRLEKQREKDARLDQKKLEKATAVPRAPGEEDPDIAGIVPGPQPIPEE